MTIKDMLRKKLNDYVPSPVSITIDDVFEPFSDEDFHFEDFEAGDPLPWYCDDCHRYHKAYYSWEFQRKDGIRSIIRHSCDEDGNWDIDLHWEENDDPTEVLEVIAHEMEEYFKAWAKYDLDCVDSGKDGFTGESILESDALKSLQENIEYLYMGRKND